MQIQNIALILFQNPDLEKALGFAIPVLILSLISTGLVVYGWMKRNTPMGKSYSVMMLALTLWLVSYSLRVIFSESNVFLPVLEYLLMVALPLTWLFFAINFSGIKQAFTPLTVSLISFVPITLAIGSIIFRDESLINHLQNSIGIGPIYDRGTDVSSFWLISHVAYSLIYFIVGTFFLLRSIQINKRLEKRQVSILTLGVLVPWIGNIILLVSASMQSNYIPPLIFILSGALIAWGIFYNHFINIITLAHNVLIDRMGDGLLILDKKNWIIEVNQVALVMFKSSRSALIGHPLSVLYKEYPKIESISKQLNIKNHEYELNVGQKTRVFNTDVIPLYGKKRVFAGKIILFKEITTLKETSKNLEKARSQADKADNLKNAFLANLSHEIKTPMNAIIGFSDLLNDVSIDDEERHEFIDHIRNSGSTLLQLIDDIMDISKLEAGQFTLNKGEVDLSKMMAELFARFNDYLLAEGKSGIDLILDTEMLSSDLNVIADGDRIRQILTNLLSNAVKFTKQGQIEFGYHLEKGTNVQFFVKDSGIGIPFDKHKMIFERFGRVYTANHQEYTGTGLGLALSRGMVRLMGGHIWFESVYGKGSSFYFTIPFEKVVATDIPVPSQVTEDIGEEKVPFTPIVPSPPPVVPDRPPIVPAPAPEIVEEPEVHERVEPEIAADRTREVEEVVSRVEPIVAPEPTTDLDAESDPYLDFLFAQSDDQAKSTTDKKDVESESKEDIEKVKEILQEAMQVKSESEKGAMPQPSSDLNAESDPFLDALFATDEDDAPAEPEVKRESIRDHIKEMPEEADLIFDPKYAPTSSIEDDTNFSGSKLLVVDYDDMSYLFIEMILRPSKIQLIRARTFQQAMNLLKGGTDLTGVLLTSEVPDIELVPGIKTLKKKHPRQNIIAITPFANEERRKECLKNGCLNVLPKPIKQRELLAAVRNLHTISNM